MRIFMNTASSGSGRIDDLQSHPQGGFRGQTKLVKITEDVRKYAAEQGIAEEEALAKGMEEKAREYHRAGSDGIDSPQASPQGSGAGEQLDHFSEAGAEIYAKART
jgi:hypothetical protein